MFPTFEIIIRLMPKRFIFFILFSLFTLLGQAQFDTSFARSGIRHCADSLIYGFKTRDWDLFARYSNPGMIGTMGGTAAFKEYISKTFAQVPDSAWKKYQPGTILQVVKTQVELQSVIELHSIIEWQGQRITATSYLVGQSWDGGRFWTFFDSQSDVNAARTIKPDLSPELIIPAKKEQVEYLSPPRPAKQLQQTAPGKTKTTGKTKDR